MAFLHAADLHIRSNGAEAGYGLSVFSELVEIASREGGGTLLLSGDVFDSNADFMALYARVRDIAEGATGLERLLILAGNHDKLRGDRGPESFDAGGKTLLAWDAPLSYRLSDGSAEFLLIPYGCDIPAAHARGGTPLVVAAHGSLPELNWIGPSEEGEKDRSVLDGSRLRALFPAYIALGHIHEGRSGALGDALAAFPGSATPWRKGETGPRNALLVNIDREGKASARKIELEAAGQFRRIDARLSLDGPFPDEETKASLAEAGKNDWVEVVMAGIARTEADIGKAVDALRRSHEGSVRKLDVDREDLVILERADDGPAAGDFYRAWEAERKRIEELYGKEAALKALEIGLARIARAGGGRP
jgi:DNA repair exonuclease SbcCD nuclease subunit